MTAKRVNNGRGNPRANVIGRALVLTFKFRGRGRRVISAGTERWRERTDDAIGGGGIGLCVSSPDNVRPPAATRPVAA